MLKTIFDPDHYRAQIDRDLDDAAALRDFRQHGDARGLDPSPYFATRWYKQRYGDWSDGGAATAAEDFLNHLSQAASRQPHPLIDPDYYRAAYPDLAGLGARAVLHFMRHGDDEGRAPSRAFDAAFYRRCYLPLGQRRAFAHYIRHGAALGYRPYPLPRDAARSCTGVQQGLAGLARPLVFVAHDAQPAGVPILTLDLARAVAARGWDPVFVLGNAGPMADRFRALGPVFVLAEGWNRAGLVRGLGHGTPALINTAAAAAMAVPLAQAGLRCAVLVHEMADYVRDQGLMADLLAARAAGARLFVSMPRMVQAYRADLGPVDWLRPGIALPPTRHRAFRAARAWRGDRAGPVCIGAGHADRRKGFDLFLSAAGRIRDARPAARFVWLGALDDWARGLADDALAQGLDLTLPGFTADSLAWYRAADVYLLTSRQDPGPATAIHAAAMGTPFVGYAADIGLIGQAEGMGIFVPPDDESGFVRTALDLADGVSAQSRRVLRRLVRAEADFDRYVDRVLDAVTAADAPG